MARCCLDSLSHSLTRTLPSQSPTASHFPCLLMSNADPGTFSACTCVPHAATHNHNPVVELAKKPLDPLLLLLEPCHTTDLKQQPHHAHNTLSTCCRQLTSSG